MDKELALQLHERLLRLERIVKFLCSSDRPEARSSYYGRTYDHPNGELVRKEMNLLTEWLEQQK